MSINPDSPAAIGEAFIVANRFDRLIRICHTFEDADEVARDIGGYVTRAEIVADHTGTAPQTPCLEVLGFEAPDLDIIEPVQ